MWAPGRGPLRPAEPTPTHPRHPLPVVPAVLSSGGSGDASAAGPVGWVGLRGVPSVHPRPVPSSCRMEPSTPRPVPATVLNPGQRSAHLERESKCLWLRAVLMDSHPVPGEGGTATESRSGRQRGGERDVLGSGGPACGASAGSERTGHADAEKKSRVQGRAGVGGRARGRGGAGGLAFHCGRGRPAHEGTDRMALSCPAWECA